MAVSYPNEKPIRGSVLLRPWTGSLLGATMAAALMFTIARQQNVRDVPSVPTEHLPATTTNPPANQFPVRVVDRAVERAKFYDDEVEPKIADADRLNREAADRCIARIEQMINRYRAGINPFVGDLTSLSTRFGIVKRMPTDWWREEQQIETYVQDKFEHHMFSEQTLMDDITVVLGDFKNEIDANQKRMLVSVKSALGTADMPEVHADEYEPFFQAVAAQLQQYSSKQGTASVQNAVGVFVISEASVFAGRTIVVGLLTRFGSAAVVSTAAGASATAGSTAAGTGTGAFGGPVGAVVGFGVGLAVGLVIDWFMTERFETQMSQQMNEYLDALNHTILHGGATDQVSPETPGAVASDGSGLIKALPVVCDRLRDAYRERFYEQLVTGAPAS